MAMDYEVRFEDERVICECSEPLKRIYPGANLLEAETTMEALMVPGKVAGTIRRYMKHPAPPGTPRTQMLVRVQKKLEDEKTVDELPADMVAAMRFEVRKKPPYAVELTKEFLNKLFSKDSEEP